MPKTTIVPCFKVVKRGHYLSYWSNESSSMPDWLKVEYKLDEWVKPRPGTGPLFVFKEEKHALSFARQHAGNVFVAKCKNPIKADGVLKNAGTLFSRIRVIFGNDAKGNAAKWRKVLKETEDISRVYDWQRESYATRAVKLLRPL